MLPNRTHNPDRSRRLPSRVIAAGAVAALVTMAWATGAEADKIKNPMAVFSGLDKITGRIISFEVATDETVQFGSLQVTPRVCYTRPATEAPQTDTFVEVDEVSAEKSDADKAAKEYKRIFSGWMYAASPGLHGIEHPIYDIWLTSCKGGTDVIAEAPPAVADVGAPPAGLPDAVDPQPDVAPKPPPPKPKRVVRASPRPPDDGLDHRQPVQSFFPTTNYSSEPAPYNPKGSTR